LAKRAPRSVASSGSTKTFYLILLAVVIAGVAWLVVAGRDGGKTQSAGVELPGAADVEADPESGVVLGAADAPVTISEFADFSCPYCASFGTFTGRLIRQNFVENGELVRWIQYDYVLGTFPNSTTAAIAARCAGEQGRYWVMHDLLLANQARWTGSASPESQFRDYAKQIGLDGGEFRRCLDERRYLDRVMSARKYGDQIGVSQTPTLFVNGRKLDNVSYEAMESAIRTALDSIGSGGS